MSLFSVLHPGIALPQGIGGHLVLAGHAGLSVCRGVLLVRVLEGSVRPRVRARQARAADEGNGILNDQDIPPLPLWSAWPVDTG